MYYKIHFPADYKNIPALRDMAAHLTSLQGFDGKVSEHMRSIVDEMVTNAIEYGSQPTSEVILELYADEKEIKITCHDQGHGNKMKASEVDKAIDEQAKRDEKTGITRGRGIKMIVRSFADSFAIKDREGGGITASATIGRKH